MNTNKAQKINLIFDRLRRSRLLETNRNGRIFLSFFLFVVDRPTYSGLNHDHKVCYQHRAECVMVCGCSSG